MLQVVSEFELSARASSIKKKLTHLYKFNREPTKKEM